MRSPRFVCICASEVIPNFPSVYPSWLSQPGLLWWGAQCTIHELHTAGELWCTFFMYIHTLYIHPSWLALVYNTLGVALVYIGLRGAQCTIHGLHTAGLLLSTFFMYIDPSWLALVYTTLGELWCTAEGGSMCITAQPRLYIPLSSLAHSCDRPLNSAFSSVTPSGPVGYWRKYISYMLLRKAHEATK